MAEAGERMLKPFNHRLRCLVHSCCALAGQHRQSGLSLCPQALPSMCQGNTMHGSGQHQLFTWACQNLALEAVESSCRVDYIHLPVYDLWQENCLHASLLFEGLVSTAAFPVSLCYIEAQTVAHMPRVLGSCMPPSVEQSSAMFILLVSREPQDTTHDEMFA